MCATCTLSLELSPDVGFHPWRALVSLESNSRQILSSLDASIPWSSVILMSFAYSNRHKSCLSSRSSPLRIAMRLSPLRYALLLFEGMNVESEAAFDRPKAWATKDDEEEEEKRNVMNTKKASETRTSICSGKSLEHNITSWNYALQHQQKKRWKNKLFSLKASSRSRPMRRARRREKCSYTSNHSRRPKNILSLRLTKCN